MAAARGSVRARSTGDVLLPRHGDAISRFPPNLTPVGVAARCLLHAAWQSTEPNRTRKDRFASPPVSDRLSGAEGFGWWGTAGFEGGDETGERAGGDAECGGGEQ